jgi:ribulose-bisphosphate carboxylase large chain
VIDRPTTATAGDPRGGDRGRLRAVYRLALPPGTPAAAIDARARALAVEQSVEMPPEAIDDPWVSASIVAQVAAIRPLADGAEVTLALSCATIGDDAGQLLNMLFGNCSLQPDVTLHDVELDALPGAFPHAMPGPRHGIAGWRAALGPAGAASRPLTCTALKPQGLPPQRLAALAGTFAAAGIDVIKDDHGIADQDYARFAARVTAVQRAVDRANAGREGPRTLYAPSLSGGPAALARQLQVVRDEGVGAVLACPLLCGVPTFVETIRAQAGVPILAHPAFAGGPRIAPALLFGKLFRAFGADATIFPNFGGRFAYSRDTCRGIADAARGPLAGHAPILPVPAGGMTIERVDEMVREFGNDTMLLIGGNLLQAGDALAERTRAFVARVAQAARHASAGPATDAAAAETVEPRR